MDPKARREVKEKEDLLDGLEPLVFMDLREQTVQKELKEVLDIWALMV